MTTRRHKYGAKRTTFDNITFASKAEARRYAELKLLEKAGEIRSLQLQPEYALNAWCAIWKSKGDQVGVYRADFRYERFKWPGQSKECETVVEDVKGMKTPMYRWKKKHVEAQYGITITEVSK